MQHFTNSDYALNKYSEGDRADYRQTWKNTPFADSDETLLNAETSAEGSYFGDIEVHEDNEQFQSQLIMAHQILDKLTEVQRRRFVMHRIEGLTTRQIAEIEGVGHSKIQKSLEGAEKKIKKVLSRR